MQKEMVDSWHHQC